MASWTVEKLVELMVVLLDSATAVKMVASMDQMLAEKRDM